MAGFQALKDVCNNLEDELRNFSTHLCSANLGESFEDVVTKKMQDLTLFTSKLRLLQGDLASGECLLDILLFFSNLCIKSCNTDVSS